MIEIVVHRYYGKVSSDDVAYSIATAETIMSPVEPLTCRQAMSDDNSQEREQAMKE